MNLWEQFCNSVDSSGSDQFRIVDYGARAKFWWVGSKTARALSDSELYIVLEYVAFVVKLWKANGRIPLKRLDPSEFDNDPMVVACNEYMDHCRLFG